MGGTPGTTFLNYKQAARRVDRSEISIQRWRREGMPMIWRTSSDGQQERAVREDILLRWFRLKLKADPVRQNKMRAAARLLLGSAEHTG